MKAMWSRTMWYICLSNVEKVIDDRIDKLITWAGDVDISIMATVMATYSPVVTLKQLFVVRGTSQPIQPDRASAR